MLYLSIYLSILLSIYKRTVTKLFTKNVNFLLENKKELLSFLEDYYAIKTDIIFITKIYIIERL